MTEEEFWTCTPRKLDALLREHSQYHSGGNKEEKTGYIDQIW